MDSNDCKEAMYKAAARLMLLDRAAFLCAVERFSASEIRIDNEHIGFVLECGNEVHAQIDKMAAMKLGRRIIKGFLAPLLDRLGSIITYSTPDYEAFLLRVGFKKIENGFPMSKYILNQIAIRGRTCQQ